MGLQKEKRVNLIVVRIKQKEQTVEVSFGMVDQDKRKMMYCSFLDNQFYSYLESLLLQLNQEGETQIIVDGLELLNQTEKVEEMVESMSIKMIKPQFDIKEHSNWKSGLEKLARKKNMKEIKVEEGNCLHQCVYELGLMDDSTNYSQYDIQQYRMKDFMKLDMAAMNALLIFPKDKSILQTMGGQQGTLIDLLDKCRTKIGSRVLIRWIRQPLQSLAEIKERLDIVDKFYHNVLLRTEVQDYFLKKIPDLDKLFVKFYRVYSKKESGKAKLQDCYKVYILVQLLKKGTEIFEEGGCEMLGQKYGRRLKECLDDFEKLEELIGKMVDMEQAQKGEYMIQSYYSKQLSELQEQKDLVLNQIEKIREEVERDLGCAVGIIDSNQHGYLFEVEKKKGDSGFRSSQMTYKQTTVKLGKISFSNHELRSVIKEYQEIQDAYEQQQKELSDKIIGIVASYYPVMETASGIISELDILSTFAMVSSSMKIPYVKPEMKESGDLILKESRHPCLEQVTIKTKIFGKDEQGVIENDLNMKEQEGKLHIITGPNMGGKSTYIRQIGIIVLMAHIGCYVPCEYAQIPLVDSIITRVGASDVQLKGISTFYQEMLEVSNMLSMATSRSLLIIDELGRGTSTDDGFGLAYAIAQDIAVHKNSYALFATHFHELTSLEQNIKGVRNYYVDCEVQQDDIIMKYKVKKGVSDHSYGILIMQKMGFPKHIIESALQKQDELQFIMDYNNGKIQQSDLEQIKSKAKKIDLSKIDCQQIKQQLQNASTKEQILITELLKDETKDEIKKKYVVQILSMRRTI